MTDGTDSRVDEYVARVRALAPLVREHAQRSERDAQLARGVVEAFHDAGLFRVLLPAAMGGGDLTLPESFRVFEEVARLDRRRDGTCRSAPTVRSSATFWRARRSRRSSATVEPWSPDR